jgi:hydrogenase maturation protease
MTSDTGPDTLVLGLGNILCGDDGLGIVALERMRAQYSCPADVSLVDGGTLGLALLPTLESAKRVWILDAVAADHPPGSLVTLAGESVEPALRERLSPHQIGVADLLDALHWRGTWPESLRVLGLVPASIDLRLGLSEPVAPNVDALVEAAVQELREAGHALVRHVGAHDEAMLESRRDPGTLALGL